MKLVMTILVRDEADIIDEQIAFHLDAGVDFVIATDHGSVDGTTEILEKYAADGYLLRLPEQGRVDEVAWRSRMARLAATDHGADWVINTDADEFWLAPDGSLKDVLGAIPPDYGVVGGVILHFVPMPDDGRPFYERMTVRLSQHAPINDPTSPWRPSPKCIHRGDGEVVILHAGHWIEATGRLEQIENWRPFEVLHFPCRSIDQWTRKTTRRGHASSDAPLGQYVRGLRAHGLGRIDDVYQALVVGDETVRRGVADRLLVRDERLLRALRPLRADSPAAARVPAGPSVGTERAQPPIDAAALAEATVVRLQRRVDDALTRASGLERRRTLGRADPRAVLALRGPKRR